MGTFLSIILFIIVGFWLLGKILRVLLQSFLLRKQREMQEQFGQDGGFKTFGGGNFRGFYGFGNPNAGQQTHSKKEGEITLEQKENRRNNNYTINKKAGEYVDFEEVKLYKSE